MADVFERAGHNGTNWTTIILSPTDYLGFFSTNYGYGLSPGVFNQSTHMSDSLGTSDLCASPHMRNCEYDTPTTIKLMGAVAVTLDETNVLEADCTLKWNYLDDSPVDTALTNCLLFAYDGSTPANPPVGCTILAAERTAGGINTETFGGVGYGWNSSYGIGGNGAALLLDTQTTATTHDFFFIISGTPTSKGLKTYKIRLEFDVT